MTRIWTHHRSGKRYVEIDDSLDDLIRKERARDDLHDLMARPGLRPSVQDELIRRAKELGIYREPTVVETGGSAVLIPRNMG